MAHFMIIDSLYQFPILWMKAQCQHTPRSRLLFFLLDGAGFLPEPSFLVFHIFQCRQWCL